MKTDHAYSPNSLRADYFKALVGMLACWAPFAYGAEVSGGMMILLVCGGLFGLLAIRTMMKSLTKFSLNGEGLKVNFPMRREISWHELTFLSLSYYSTWRNGDNGWMQLTLKDGRKSLRLESNVSGFEDIVGNALAAAHTARLQLDQKTLRNAEAMNFTGPAGAVRGDEQLA